MDLKGPLEDTNLRIYPSKKLVDFIQTVAADVIPTNFQLFRKVKQNLNDTDSKILREPVLFSSQLNEKDYQYLQKIKIELGGEITDKPKTEGHPETEEHPETKDNPENKLPEHNQDTDPSEADEREDPYLSTSDIDWLYAYLQNKRKTNTNIPYIHELLEGTDVQVPKNKKIKRDPILEARCIKLRAQQEAREYRKMTRGVDNVRMRFPDDSIAYQLKQINRQLIAIGQFIISIFAGFLFGFRGVEWLVGNLDFGFRLLLGVMCALVIALAEIYFLAKKLNEELCVPETVQLGGPPKFLNPEKYGYEPSAATGAKKEHQD